MLVELLFAFRKRNFHHFLSTKWKANIVVSTLQGVRISYMPINHSHTVNMPKAHTFIFINDSWSVPPVFQTSTFWRTPVPVLIKHVPFGPIYFLQYNFENVINF